MKVSQCKACRRPISWARRGDDTQRWACLDAAPVRPEQVWDAHTARVVIGAYAFTIPAARERQADPLAFERSDRTPIEDYPWHSIHDCPKKEARSR